MSEKVEEKGEVSERGEEIMLNVSIGGKDYGARIADPKSLPVEELATKLEALMLSVMWKIDDNRQYGPGK